MSLANFARTELTAAMERGVQQCVVIGAPTLLDGALKNSPERTFQIFSAGSEALAESLEKSGFDTLKATLFIWLGEARYRSAEAAIASLAFMASLPSGSGVVFDYVVERTGVKTRTHAALDSLASRILTAGGSVKHLIQPQAVTAMLRGLGSQRIVDLTLSGRHFVSAVI